MNKHKGIIVGVLALAVTMMVGYALFSETITINGTATAKGSFNITPTCIAGVPEEAKSVLVSYGLVEGGYENETCTVNDANDTVTFSVNLKYPGARREFSVKMTNTGTINSEIQDILPYNPRYELCYSDDINADPKTGTCKTGTTGGAVLYAVQVGDGPIYVAEEVPEEVMNEFMVGETLILKPGNSAYYLIDLAIPDNIEYPNGTLNAIYTAPIKGTFTQTTLN